MKRIFGTVWMALAIVGWAAFADARVWTDATGMYTLEANLVAFDDTHVILQRGDHHLGAVPIEKLSEADREYLKSKEALDAAERVTSATQTWTLRNGLKIPGKVVGFARKPVTLQRRRSKIYVNERLFDNLPEVYQKMLPHIVANFEPIEPLDKEGIEKWLVRQKGGPKTFTLDGVYLELESGDEYGVPFFFFSQEDLNVLQPGWERWLQAHEAENYDDRDQQSFMLQAAAAARQQNQQIQRQIALMQLNLQAVQAGVTSLWEVTLYPARAGVGPPLWVVMPGRNSAQATAAALANNPGYVAGPVRRVSN